MPTTPRLRPLGNRVLIRRHDAPTTTPGGLHLPATSAPKADRGVVVATGPGGVDLTTGRRVRVSVLAGEIVLIARSAMEIDVDGEKLVLVQEHEILGVWRDPGVADAADAAVPKRKRRKDAGVRRGPRVVKNVTVNITRSGAQPSAQRAVDAAVAAAVDRTEVAS